VPAGLARGGSIEEEEEEEEYQKVKNYVTSVGRPHRVQIMAIQLLKT
jgi:hypothetical protein